MLLENLNDNVREDFLRTLLKKQSCDVVHLTIAYHPTTKKHLGLAHVELATSQMAAACIKAMNGRSVMGNVIVASKDPLGMYSFICPFTVSAEYLFHPENLGASSRCGQEGFPGSVDHSRSEKDNYPLAPFNQGRQSLEGLRGTCWFYV